MPVFAMTAHKTQSQTMDKVLVDLKGCHGTESPYVMLSRVKSLEGLQILQPFNIRKIQCHQSEDARRELQCLSLLQLLMIMELKSALESTHAWNAVSRTQYRDQIVTQNCEGNESPSSDSIHHLNHLQQTNFHLTSAPCPLVSLSSPHNLSSSYKGPPVQDGQDHCMSFSLLS